MSRAINRLVAIEVLGKAPCGDRSMVADGSGLMGYTCPDYAGNPFYWDQVIRHHATGYVEIHNGWGERDGERVGGWKCRIVVPGGEGEAREPTIGMAVCIAALRAVGVAEDEIEKTRGKA